MPTEEELNHMKLEGKRKGNTTTIDITSKDPKELDRFQFIYNTTKPVNTMNKFMKK